MRILLSRRRSPCRRRRRTHLPAIAFSAREHYCAQDDFVDVAGIPSSFGSSPIESTPPTTLAAEALELFTFFPTHHALVSVTNERREPFERTRRVTVSFSDPVPVIFTGTRTVQRVRPIGKTILACEKWDTIQRWLGLPFDAHVSRVNGCKTA